MNRYITSPRYLFEISEVVGLSPAQRTHLQNFLYTCESKFNPQRNPCNDTLLNDYFAHPFSVISILIDLADDFIYVNSVKASVASSDEYITNRGSSNAREIVHARISITAKASHSAELQHGLGGINADFEAQPEHAEILFPARRPYTCKHTGITHVPTYAYIMSCPCTSTYETCKHRQHPMCISQGCTTKRTAVPAPKPSEPTEHITVRASPAVFATS
jgi:hypothetical protein